jgi:transposase
MAQKISGGWRTPAGAHNFCKIRSYIATARKHETNLFHALRQAFEGDPWIPTATGPPLNLASAA